MMKYPLLVVLFLTTNLLFSQKRELGKVTIEELKEKYHPIDSLAPAAILFQTGKTTFQYSQEEGFYLVTEVEVKIKIYTKEGYEFANEAIQFYVGGNEKESVDFSKAFTYNLVGDKVEKTKLKGENEFIENVNKFWSVKKITMPNVREGSIIEYKYEIKSPYYSVFPEWKFQKSIPVKFSQYETNIPEYFTYNVYRKGSLIPVESKSKEGKTISITNKDLVRSGAAIKYERTNESINYTVEKVVYTLENLKALNDESFVNNIENYTAGLQHELSGKKMPNSMFESFSLTWEDVVKNIYKNDNFGEQLNITNYFENDIKGFINDQDKVNKIFEFVKTRMNWNGLYGYNCDEGVKKAYQNKTGNVADINLMLVAMLKYANVDADPVLISTRSNGIPLFPSRTAFNYVIVRVNNNEKSYFLDATDKNAMINILPLRDLNWNGRLVKNDGYSEMLDLMPQFISNDVVTVLAKIENESEISGQTREQYFAYNAYNYRNKYRKLNKESIVENVEKKFDGLEINDYEVTNVESLNEPVIEKYAFVNKNEIEKIGNKILFSPLMHFKADKNPFLVEKREYPIDFSFPFKDKYSISIAVPDGYEVAFLPETITLSMDNNYGVFSYIINSSANQIQLVVNFEINVSIVPAEDYVMLKEFFDRMIQKQNEKVILVKK